MPPVVLCNDCSDCASKGFMQLAGVDLDSERRESHEESGRLHDPAVRPPSKPDRQALSRLRSLQASAPARGTSTR